MTRSSIILGTRGSALALKQTDMVKEALSRAWPDLGVTVKIISTTGDRRTDVPLSQVARVAGIADKGIFLKEIEQALETGEIDFAVHSLKDMPSELDAQFELAAVLPRAHVDDVLVFKGQNSRFCRRIATGSVRRRRMGEVFWGEKTKFEDLRGNVPTRLAKLAANPALDGIILARAGLERLGLFASESCCDGVSLRMELLPGDVFVPAAGQGIVGLEIRKEDAGMRAILSAIDHAETHLQARAEREFLRLLGADCSTPVGVHAELLPGGMMNLRALLFRDSEGLPPFAASLKGLADEPEILAERLWKRL